VNGAAGSETRKDEPSEHVLKLFVSAFGLLERGFPKKCSCWLSCQGGVLQGVVTVVRGVVCFGGNTCPLIGDGGDKHWWR
jgi:hypothetical protein